jgi:hypothetical protein
LPPGTSGADKIARPFCTTSLVKQPRQRRQRRRAGVAPHHLARLHHPRRRFANIDRDRLGGGKQLEQVAQDAVEQLALLERRRHRLHERVERAQLAIGVLELGEIVRHARVGRERRVERVDDLRRRLRADLRVHLHELGDLDRPGVVERLRLELAGGEGTTSRRQLRRLTCTCSRGAVGAVEIVDDVAARLSDLGVLARDARVVRTTWLYGRPTRHGASSESADQTI